MARKAPVQMPKKPGPVITVKDLYKIYRIGENRVRALNGVSFTINRGEFCAIVGTSGSGKSTLLNMLAGLEKPTKGEIVIVGEHMETKSENQLVRFRREHIGFIFQSFNLMGTMNAVENVALPLTFQGVSKRERKKRARKMVHLVGLDKYWDHRPNQMSGGQQQRVGVARALVVNPEIIFADEPTGNLDSNTSKEIMNLMQSVVREQNQTLIMVTHDNQLASFADRIIRIVDGKIVDMIDNTNKEQKDETAAEHTGSISKVVLPDNTAESEIVSVEEQKRETADNKENGQEYNTVPANTSDIVTAEERGGELK